MAVFNGEQYIEEQIISILDQIFPGDELIISDDGSTDRTQSIVESIDDDRIIYTLNKKVNGYTGNFENALTLARGDTIFLSDQDDVWHDGKVKLCLEALKESDFVVSDAKVVDEKLQVIAPSYFILRATKFGFINSLMRCRYLGCCYAFNRCVLHRALPFPCNHKMLPHDLWLVLIAEFFFKVKYLPVQLINYRRHGLNVSSGGEISVNSLSFKIKFRLYALFNILKVICAR